MGDRCYMKVITMEENAYLFKEIGFCEENIENGVAELVDFEANYAHGDEMPAVPYIAYNAAGGDYGDGCEVCDGDKTMTASVNKEWVCVVEVDDDGNVVKDQLKYMRGFVKFRKKVELMFKMRRT